jgi:hypothetical protein
MGKGHLNGSDVTGFICQTVTLLICLNVRYNYWLKVLLSCISSDKHRVRFNFEVDRMAVYLNWVFQTNMCKVPYTLAVRQRFYCVRSYRKEKLSKLRSFEGNSPGLRTVLSSRLSHTELRSSFRESHSFLSLPGIISRHSTSTSVSNNSFSRWASHDIFLFKYHFLLHILRFLFFFSDNIMADVASQQQTTALFLSTIITRTRRHTELTKKNWQTWWETCAVLENIQFSFSCSFFTRLNCTV